MAEQVSIRHLTAPIDSAPLRQLLGHKGTPWVEDICNRSEGRYPGSEDHFLLAEVAGRPVAHVWYTVAAADRRLGLLGHVYTCPEHRRQGISTRLIRAAMAEFAQCGGQVMQLFTSTPYTVPLYEQLGYENVYSSPVYHERDWYMRHPLAAPQILDSWFAKGSCRIRKLTAADLPKYCLLYNFEYGTLLKDWAQGVGLGLEAECAFIRTIDRMGKGEAVCFALDNEHTIVGLASLVRCEFAHQSHVAALDYYLHPHFQDHARPLIEACLAAREDLGVEILYVLCVDPPKQLTFAQLGFHTRAALRGHYRIENRRCDATLLQAPASRCCPEGEKHGRNAASDKT